MFLLSVCDRHLPWSDQWIRVEIKDLVLRYKVSLLTRRSSAPSIYVLVPDGYGTPTCSLLRPTPGPLFGRDTTGRQTVHWGHSVSVEYILYPSCAGREIQNVPTPLLVP